MLDRLFQPDARGPKKSSLTFIPSWPPVPWLRRALHAKAALSTLVVTLGCGSETMDGGYADAGQDGFRFLTMNYPAQVEENLVTCATWENGTGDRKTTNSNEYDFALMNNQLKTDARFANWARMRDLSRVESCADALRFSQLQSEFVEQRLQIDAPPIDERPSSYEDTSHSGASLPNERSPQVWHGLGYNVPYVFRIRLWKGDGFSETSLCSGFLIGERTIVTAAHCIPSTKARPITIVAYDGTCVYPSGHSNCSTKPSPSDYAFGHRHPDYTGDGDASDDIGLYVLNHLPAAPANTATARLRIATDLIPRGHSFWKSGYGANSFDGSGSGVLRIGDESTHVDGLVPLIGSKYMMHQLNSLEPRLCKGDSGGPAISTALIENHDLAIAVNSEFSSPINWNGSCGNLDDWDRMTLIGPKLPWIESKIGECSSFESNGFSYKRCW